MDDLDRLAAEVRSSAKYRAISAEVVRRVAAQELTKGRSYKESLKAVRGKLHQVGGAYQGERVDYAAWRAELANLPRDLSSVELQAFCRRVMAQHASTRERLSIVERFFHETLASIAPLTSILDLACGLNPLALPFMPLAQGAVYSGCDIYEDMLAFDGDFLRHAGVAGASEVCDLVARVPDTPVQVAFALKTIPCLEQMDKAIAPRLLAGLNAVHVLVSFPARSLGGRAKGMPEFYEAHLMDLIEGQDWSVRKFAYPSETTFLLSRG